MARVYDAIVNRAGHNGLVTSAYLARAGWSVLVLERRHLVGGASVTEALWPGYRVSSAAYLVSLMQPKQRLAGGERHDDQRLVARDG